MAGSDFAFIIEISIVKRLRIDLPFPSYGRLSTCCGELEYIHSWMSAELITCYELMNGMNIS